MKDLPCEARWRVFVRGGADHDHAGHVATAQQLGWKGIQFIDAGQCGRELIELGALPSPDQAP